MGVGGKGNTLGARLIFERDIRICHLSGGCHCRFHHLVDRALLNMRFHSVGIGYLKYVVDNLGKKHALLVDDIRHLACLLVVGIHRREQL